jgi:penicillin amidase
VLVGRSDKLGWGLTTAGVDDQDVVIEKLNPDNPEEYLLPDGSYAAFDSRQTIVQVKDAASR